MKHRVAVVGAAGRVGRAVCEHLDDRFQVVAVQRSAGETSDDLAHRAVAGADALVNAAGVAHVESLTPEDLERLQTGNVELPVALAAAALVEGIPMIHVSSAKAADPRSTSPYSVSKREGDERLERGFGDAFAAAGTSLVIVRPPALLFPPLDAGKVSRLRFLRWWPDALTPPARLPVLAPVTFLAAVESAVETALARVAQPGLSYRDFDRAERGTMRDIRDAMLAWTEEGDSR